MKSTEIYNTLFIRFILNQTNKNNNNYIYVTFTFFAPYSTAHVFVYFLLLLLYTLHQPWMPKKNGISIYSQIFRSFSVIVFGMKFNKKSLIIIIYWEKKLPPIFERERKKYSSNKYFFFAERYWRNARTYLLIKLKNKE
jgi:hypothetical protein